ncbi:MAG: ATP-binding protein [Kiritimatiellales bacterium]|nr:ATP-binding protein [Kiritimatiellales bacterium]
MKNDPAASGFKSAICAILIFLFLGTCIITIGILLYIRYERDYRAEAGRQLIAISELKVGELIQYRKERLGDGNVFYKNLVFSRLVRRFFDQPEDTDARQQLELWLGKIQNYYQYSRVFLIDTQAVERLSIPAGAVAAADLSSYSIESLRSGRVSFFDFHRYSPNQSIVLGVLVPVFAESGTNVPLGVLVLQIDPTTYLYPFIQRWPVPSETAETLLVRREGDKAVFLNPLRFQTNAVLTLRASLANTDLPAAKAVLGQKGVVEGVDYRGVPVLAAVSPVPDSPWFMVAREDISEIFSPMRAQFWQVVGMISILLFGSGAVIGLVWRQQRVRFYREKAKVAEALRESEEQYRSIVESSPSGLYSYHLTADNHLILTGANPAADRILGIPHLQLLGKTIEEAFPVLAGTEIPEMYRKVARREIDSQHMETDYRDGMFNGCYDVTVFRSTPGNIVVSFRDITQRKQAEQRLAETTEHLRASNRDLEQFAYIASHDLQEPLRMVANYVQLLERRYKDKLDQDAKDFISYAADGAVRMQALIDSLLEYSRLQTRKKPFEEVNLQKTLGRVMRDLEGRILETGARVTIDPLPHVFGDGLQLGLVFQNFISNALKFRGEKPPEVHVAAEEFSNHWKITVSDNGIGIEPEHQERIFKIFQRLYSRSEYPGTGIGLAICQRIIERHGGKTGVESELKKGSLFWFTLPKKGET